MLTFIAFIVILVICLLYIRKLYKIPSFNTIKEIVSNSSISGIKITSRFFKIRKLSYFNTQVSAHQTPSYVPPAKPYHIINSPMVGTFHLSYIERINKKDKEPIIFIGKIIKKGDKVGIINAMRLDNEVKSPYSGMIIDMLVEDGSPVEYGQPLMFVEQI